MCIRDRRDVVHRELALVHVDGISFYTFQAISYAVDVYKRKFTMDDITLLEYCFYLTFFPLLLAGPITRAKNLLPRLRRNQQASSRMVWTGLWLIMLGLVKKNMISDYIGQFTTWVFDAPQTFSGFENLAAMLGYPVQIYFCLLYTSPSPRDLSTSRMPSSA